jgi:hypothetical protein
MLTIHHCWLEYCEPENSLETHDVAIPIGGDAGKRLFRAIILSSNAAACDQLQNITIRLARFHALTAGLDCAIFFLQLNTSACLSPLVLQSQYASFQNIQLLMIKNNISMQNPMSKEVFTGLSDVVSNMRELVIFAGQRDAFDRLKRIGMSEYEIHQFQEFWSDEFVADVWS